MEKNICICITKLLRCTEEKNCEFFANQLYFIVNVNYIVNLQHCKSTIFQLKKKKKQMLLGSSLAGCSGQDL